MQKHESKTCPSCQQDFECRCGDIINCQCETVELVQKYRDYIFKLYDDCLCASCLKKLRTQYNIETFNQKINAITLAR